MITVSVNGTDAVFEIGCDNWVRCSAPITIRADRSRPVVQAASLPMPYGQHGSHLVIVYKHIYLQGTKMVIDVVEDNFMVA